jgi:hypothetical protein
MSVSRAAKGHVSPPSGQGLEAAMDASGGNIGAAGRAASFVPLRAADPTHCATSFTRFTLARTADDFSSVVVQKKYSPRPRKFAEGGEMREAKNGRRWRKRGECYPLRFHMTRANFQDPSGCLRRTRSALA